MAYGEKYKYYFYWDHDDSNNYYKVSILEEGYSSSITTLTPGVNPWSMSIKGQLDTSENPILGSAAEFEVISSGNEYITYDADFLASDYKDFIVKLIEDPDGTPVIKWVGFMMPANATRPFTGNTKPYSLSAVDGLADLKNKSYSTDGQSTGSRYNGFQDILTIIKTAIGKVADISELQLPFKIQLGTYSNLMSTTENAFKENEIVQELFSEIEGAETKFDSCYEVLEKILTTFYCGMCQTDGYYQIFCHIENGSFIYEYDWATLTEQSRSSFTRAIDISGYDFFNRGTLYKTAPFKTYDIRLYNKTYVPEKIINGGFDSGISDWANGDADDSSNQWTDINSTITPATGGVLEAEYSDVATTGNYHTHTSTSFELEVSGVPQSVNVSVKVQYVSSTPNSISDSEIRLRLWNGTDGYKIGTGGYQTITNKGSFIEFTETFDVTSYTDTTNYLDIEIQVNDANTTDLLIYFDNVSVKQGTINLPVDWLYTSIRTTGKQTENKEIILYIADKQESDNDICAVRDVSASYPTTWNRYSRSSDLLTLVTILQVNNLTQIQRYMNYVRVNIYDPNQTILPNNMVNYSATEFYRIIGMKINYREATINLDLGERAVPVDVGYETNVIKLDTEYGK